MTIGGGAMRCCHLVGAVVAAALATPIGAATAFDDAKYPDWKGQWGRFSVVGLPGQPSFDQTKGWGPYQEAPLTPEYQKVLEESMADQQNGGLGNYSTARCLPGGMPRMMMAFEPLEYVITPDITYILIGEQDHYRRIYTDGREWPTDLEPTYQGYSIGKWIDEDGDGRYDLLEVETRGPFKGPRAFDASGLPMHFDNQSVFLEKFYRDKANPEFLHDEITVIDHALTRPWTVNKRYVHNPDPSPRWGEFYCSENSAEITVGKENYFISSDGLLMPARKDQSPPDLRYFKQPRK
jgi:hypothetical protein